MRYLEQEPLYHRHHDPITNITTTIMMMSAWRGVCSNLSNLVLNALAAEIPELVGGSADLTGSNKTLFKVRTRSMPVLCQ